MLRSRFFWRNFLAYMLIVSLMTGVASYLLTVKTEQFIKNSTQESLRDKLGFLVPILNSLTSLTDSRAQENLFQMARDGNTRITIIDDDGKVVLETKVEDPITMDNHRNRPEIVQAANSEFGSSVRYSNTVKRPLIYVAQKVTIDNKQYFARVSVPLGELEERLADIRESLIVGGAIAILISIFIAWFLAKRVTKPIAEITEVSNAISRGNYHVRVTKLPSNELGQLGHAINHLAAAVQSNINRRKKLENIRQQFSSNISHELKTPLTSVRGYVETLLDGAIHDSNNNIRFLKIILSNIERLISLVNDLLNLSTIEANEGLIEISPVDWQQIIRDVINRQSINIEKKQIQLHFPSQEEAHFVSGDARAMSHILDNLLQNAINYTPSGGEIRIAFKMTERFIDLTVSDTGIGIGEENQSRIFERFYRVDDARSRDQGGTGLGLAIVKHLLIQIHGSITVESTPGKGSCFTVRLPKAKKNETKTPLAEKKLKMRGEEALHLEYRSG